MSVDEKQPKDFSFSFIQQRYELGSNTFELLAVPSNSSLQPVVLLTRKSAAHWTKAHVKLKKNIASLGLFKVWSPNKQNMTDKFEHLAQLN